MISTNATSFISFPSIFFPRYSGVRPIISPQRKTARITYIIIFINPTPFPPNTQLSIMCRRGTIPPRGVNVSCILLTVPVVKDVVVVVKSADWATPNRTSFPSMLPILWLTPAASITGLPALSEKKHKVKPTRNKMDMAAKIVRP